MVCRNLAEFLDFVHRLVFQKNNFSKAGSVLVLRCEEGDSYAIGS
jgi:hypothetical protein